MNDAIQLQWNYMPAAIEKLEDTISKQMEDFENEKDVDKVD